MSLGPYPWMNNSTNTSNKFAGQTESTYLDHMKIKGFEDVGYFLEAYVVSGGIVTLNSTRNDMVDATNIVVSLNNDVMARDGTSFQTVTPSATYYLDFSKDGDWKWGTAHPTGTAGTDYLTVAYVTTTSVGLVGSITDTRGEIGGFRLKNRLKVLTPAAADDAANKGYVDNVPYNIYRQSIINGGFDVAQRGTSFLTPTNGAYTLDRYVWSMVLDGGANPNMTHTQQQLVNGELPGSMYAYRITLGGAGSGYGAGSLQWLAQKIEHGTRLLCGAGRKVTVSFMARTNIANKKIGLWMRQTYGTGGSPSAGEVINGTNWTLTNTWARYTATFDTNTLAGKTFGASNDDHIELAFTHQWGATLGSRVGAATTESFGGAGYIDIAQTQVNAGDTALPYQPRSFADELALCQRYYFKTFSYTTVPAQSAGYNGAYMVFSQVAGVTFGGTLRFPMPMRITPTITTYNPIATNANWRDTSGVDRVVAVDRANEKQVALYGLAGGVGENVIHLTADAEL